MFKHFDLSSARNHSPNDVNSPEVQPTSRPNKSIRNGVPVDNIVPNPSPFIS